MMKTPTMMRRAGACGILFVFLSMAGCATLSEPGAHYEEGMAAVKNGQISFAIVHFRTLISEDPHSIHAPAATFALAEYYYDNSDYFNAIKTLSRYLTLYPKDKGAVFAKLIVYKIITAFKDEATLSSQEEALTQDIRKELFAQPLFLIFYDKKSPRSYRSLFKHTYLVYDYVDQIKVFRDGKLFLELAP